MVGITIYFNDILHFHETTIILYGYINLEKYSTT